MPNAEDLLLLDAARPYVNAEEGLRLFVYDDATGKPIVANTFVHGNPTIAWGRCLSTNGLSSAEADMLRDNDLLKAAALCRAEFSWFGSLTRIRQVIVALMVFQMGLNGVLGFKRMLAAIGQGDWAIAKKEMLDSLWAKKQTPERAKRMADLMLKGS